MAEGKKISKEKGVQLCADLQYAGKSRKEIVQEIAQMYKASTRTIDNWIKEATPIVAQRNADAEAIRARVDKEEIEASAKRLNLTRERILEEYSKIGFFDIRKIFTVDGGLKPINELDDDSAGAIAGIETFEVKTDVKEDGETVESVVQGVNRKIKITDKRGALDSICKVLGYNAPEKQDVDIKSNGQTVNPTFIIRRRSDTDPA